MSWRPGAALFALALLAVSLALPLATADHAFSHRYIVFGRVVDASGDPVSGITVNLGYEPPFEPEGSCANQPNTDTQAWGPTTTRPVTNDYGEFMFCFHTHSMSRTLPGTGIVRIDDADYEKRVEFDPYTRHSFVPIVLDQERAEPNPAASDFTLHATVWRDVGETFLEGVKVFGVTVDNAPVDITFTYNGKEPVKLSSTTNGYGDVAIRVPVTERVTSGTVTMTVANVTKTQEIDAQSAKLGVASLRIEAGDPDAGLPSWLLPAGAVIVLVGGGGTAIWLATSRARAAREERLLRETSQRRRANK